MTNTGGQHITRSSTDLAKVEISSWPSRAFPLQARQVGAGIPIVLQQSVLNMIAGHARERTDIEVCGVLVGSGYRDVGGPFLYIEAAIRGEHAQNTLTRVTFTNETWDHIHRELETKWPKLRILGWYHTHPGFGVFLSEMDLFICRHFFDGGEQCALVFDPLANEQGLFIWCDGEMRQTSYQVEAEEWRTDSAKGRHASESAAQSLPAMQAANGDRSAKKRTWWTLLTSPVRTPDLSTTWLGRLIYCIIVIVVVGLCRDNQRRYRWPIRSKPVRVAPQKQKPNSSTPSSAAPPQGEEDFEGPSRDKSPLSPRP